MLTSFQGLEQLPIDLSSLFNNCGVASIDRGQPGDFDSFGNCYPIEYLPPSSTKYQANHIEFQLPDWGGGRMDNMELRNQEITWHLEDIRAIALLGASDFGDLQDDIQLLASSSSPKVRLGFTQWRGKSTQGTFGEQPAILAPLVRTVSSDNKYAKAIIWAQLISLPSNVEVVGLRFPCNPSLHIFALTLFAGTS